MGCPGHCNDFETELGVVEDFNLILTSSILCNTDSQLFNSPFISKVARLEPEAKHTGASNIMNEEPHKNMAILSFV